MDVHVACGTLHSAAMNASTATLLTPRQTQILQGLADGKSQKVIAYELGVSYHTIDAHRKQMFRRLGVNSSTAAVAWGFRNGKLS